MTRTSTLLDELVDGIRERCDEAFSTVYRLTASGLASYAYGMLQDRLSAEDAVQQAFLELARSGMTIRGDGRSLRAWLYKSVRFTCLDEIRRRSRRQEELTAEIPELSVRTEIPLPDPALQGALMELSERQRSLIILRHVVGLSGEEVAAVMGIARAAAYAATARAERRLRKLLEGIETQLGMTSQQSETFNRHGGAF